MNLSDYWAQQHRIHNKAVLDAINAYLDDYGYPPTIRDLKIATGSSTGGVSGALKRLVASGEVVKTDKWKARNHTTPAALKAMRERKKEKK